MKHLSLLLLPLLCALPLRADPPPADAPSLFASAKALYKAGQPEAASAEGEKRLATCRVFYGERNPALAPYLREMANLDLLLNLYAKAEALFQETLTLRIAEAKGGDAPAVAAAALELGWFYSNMTEYEKARALFDQSLAMRQRLYGQSAPPVAEVLNGLGVLEENRGHFPEAEKAYLAALAIREDRYGPDAAATTTTVNNLATLYWSMGENEKAALYFTRALEARERTQGPEALVTATSLNNLALLYRSLGAYEKAEPLLRRVLRIRREKLGSDHPFTLITESDLGLIYHDLHEDAKAEPLLLRVATLQRRIIGPGPDTARSLFHLACFYDETGRTSEATPLHEEALEMRLKILGERHPETAGSYGFLGRHDHLMGDFKAARLHYDKALSIDLGLLGPLHADTLTLLEERAALSLDEGHREEARHDARIVWEAQDKLRSSLFRFTTEGDRIALEKSRSPYDLPAALATTPDSVRDLARIVFRTKGAVLDSLVEDRLASQASRDPETAQVLARLRVLSHAAQGAAPDEANRGRIEGEQIRLQAELSRRLFGTEANRRALNVDPDAVLKALPQGAALVEWVKYRSYTGRLEWKPAYGALVMGPGNADSIRWVPIGEAADVDEAVRLYQKAMRCRMSNAAVTRILRNLHDRIWLPVAAVLPPGTHRVVVSPDGELNFVSFATLLAPSGRFLADAYSIDYVSSGRDLLRDRTGADPSSKTLAVFADPDFGGSKTPARAGSDLSPLPGTRKEARFLLDHAAGWGLRPESHLGREATKAALTALDSPYILHLATHARILGADAFPDVLPPNPMQRNLIFLTGAQPTLAAWQKGLAPPSATDGTVSAEEAGTLDLDGTWLVSLSACDTGGGEALAGEGVLGLRRGFLLAGAHHLLMTLWPVSDEATVPLIEDFYTRALAPEGQRPEAGVALAEAQRRRLQALRETEGVGAAARKAGAFILSF
ncbi:MAG TPA: CHAT domain-containing tetratricopeptide repeat protein [Candidatus Methylacidiphilales bacterium]